MTVGSPHDLRDLAANGDVTAERLLTEQALSGSLDAQRALLDALSVPSRAAHESYRLESVARLAAAQGDASDGRRLAVLLWTFAKELAAIGYQAIAEERAAESFSILRALADDGDHCANECLQGLVPHFPRAWAAIEAVEGPKAEQPPAVIIVPPDAGEDPQWELQTQIFVALYVARLIADQLGYAFADVLPVIQTVPDASIPLLNSPGGWTAIADFVSQRIGADGPRLCPTVH